jgi:hypothetical protein
MSRIVSDSAILPILLPVMKDVPLRRLTNAAGESLLSMAAISHELSYEAYCPLAGKLQRDDLLFRVIQEGDSARPYVMVLQVKDELGTISHSSLLYVKYKLSFYDETLPQCIIDEVVSFAEKRNLLKW